MPTPRRAALNIRHSFVILSSSSCYLPSGCEVLRDELTEGLGAVAAHLVARAVQALAQAGSEVEKILFGSQEEKNM